MTPRTTLVVGGTGTTGSRVAARLRAAGGSARVATRHPRPGGDEVAFDWTDPATHAAALAGADGVYLVAPIGVADPAPLVEPFLAEAKRAGARRVVLLSSSATPETTTPGLGDLHRIVRADVAEWAVLQPSWFMQNFVHEQHHGGGIRARGAFLSATGDGRVPLIDADDIAAVAVHALLDPEPHNTAHLLTGPEALSYDDVAAIISEVAGRPVRHRRVGQQELTEHLQAVGVPEDFARLLADLDVAVARGEHELVTSTVARVTGCPPRSFRDFATANRSAFRLPAAVATMGVRGG